MLEVCQTVALRVLFESRRGNPLTKEINQKEERKDAHRYRNWI